MYRLCLLNTNYCRESHVLKILYCISLLEACLMVTQKNSNKNITFSRKNYKTF